MNQQPVVEKKESVQLHPPKRSPSPSDILVVPATMSPSRLHEELIVPSQTVVRGLFFSFEPIAKHID